MENINKIFINTSGRRIQIPNRISDEFCWEPMERIKILEKKSSENRTPSYIQQGYIVHNMDYCGRFYAHETAWIDDKTLKDNFKEL